MLKHLSRVCLLLLVLTLIPGMALARKTEITFWHMETPPWRVAVFQELIDEFNAQNPEFEFKQNATSWGEAFTKVFSAARANTLPDFSFAIPDYALMLQEAGLLQPVDDIVAKIDEKFGYLPSVLQPYSYKGKYWGVPTWSMNILLFYRTDLLNAIGYDDLPRTWPEFLEVVKALTKDGVYGIGLPKAKNMWGDQVVWSFLAANEGHIFDNDGKLDFNNENTVETYQYLKELSHYSPPDSSGWAWGEGQVAFTGGKIAILPIFGGMRNWEVNAPEMSTKVKAAPIPTPSHGGNPGTYSSVNSVVIFTKDKEKRQAISKFIEFLMEPERNGYWLSNMEPGTYIPITNAAVESESYWKHPIINKHKEALKVNIEAQKTGKLFGFVNKPNPAIGPISGANILSAAAQKVYFGEMTPEQAVAWAEKEMKAVTE